MSQVQTDSSGTGTSVVEQAQGKLQEGAGQARGAVREQISGQIEQRSNDLGRQLQDVAEAFRRTGRELDPQGEQTPARLVQGVGDRAERIGSYLSDSSSDRILHDAEHFGRRNPWLVIAGGMMVGLVASRLIKASSNKRFDQLRSQGYNSRLPQSQWQGIPRTTGPSTTPGP
jgi:ElaB/YqjD/DUF883 family membrane-anchored ribosome-binding protein